MSAHASSEVEGALAASVQPSTLELRSSDRVREVVGVVVEDEVSQTQTGLNFINLASMAGLEADRPTAQSRRAGGRGRARCRLRPVGTGVQPQI